MKIVKQPDNNKKNQAQSGSTKMAVQNQATGMVRQSQETRKWSDKVRQKGNGQAQYRPKAGRKWPCKVRQHGDGIIQSQELSQKARKCTKSTSEKQSDKKNRKMVRQIKSGNKIFIRPT